MNKATAAIVDHKGTPCIELKAGPYMAIIANTLGSNVLRFRDEEKGMEIFRYKDDVSIREIMEAPEIWGLPTLYLPNRLDNGVLKTSDGEYYFPVNETRFKNHLHGFLQKRAHKIEDMGVKDGKAYAVTSYTYDENDFFFSVFPLKFKVTLTFELSESGLSHNFKIVNMSEKMLPVSVATHTTINAPFVDGGHEEDIRIQIPIEKKCLFDRSRWLPTEEFADLNRRDLSYKRGVKCPVLKDICNDMYTAGTVDLEGEKFHGCLMKDMATGKQIRYETSEEYKFWIIWNDRGFKGYFCPEPMTAMVNAPNLKMPVEFTGYRELKPAEEFTCTQRFSTAVVATVSK